MTRQSYNTELVKALPGEERKERFWLTGYPPRLTVQADWVPGTSWSRRLRNLILWHNDFWNVKNNSGSLNKLINHKLIEWGNLYWTFDRFKPC